MTKKQKELLLKDLCARLPYGVIVKYKSQEGEGDVQLGCGNIGYVLQLGNGWWKECKPYLRTMLSMTEEEKEDWHDTFDSVYDLVPGGDPDNEDDYDDNWHEQPGIESYDWLNEHHFDYRGLIEKGLALEVTENMYQI